MDELVTIVFTAPGGRRAQVEFEWVEGKRLKQYLKESVLTKYGMIGMFMRSRVQNQDLRVMRLNDCLKRGDIIFLNKVTR